MKLIWLHGPPAAGKLTVARHLQQNCGFRLLHNHLVVDLCLAVYDQFGEADFHDFANSMRRTVLAKACELGVDCMTMTYMVCGESDKAAVRKYLDFFQEQAIDVYPVQLRPGNDVLIERVIAEDRQRSSKMSCPARLGSLLAEKRFLPIAHEKLLVIDNSAIAPAKVADLILGHLGRNSG